jgi:hypothetical protein
MAFFGETSQRDTALTILVDLAIGGGGYGVIAGLVNLVDRLSRGGHPPARSR